MGSQAREIEEEMQMQNTLACDFLINIYKSNTRILFRANFTGKDSDAGKDWGQEEKRVSENEMVIWHRQLNGSEQTLGDSEEQGGLVWRSPWSHKELDAT